MSNLYAHDHLIEQFEACLLRVLDYVLFCNKVEEGRETKENFEIKYFSQSIG